MRFIGALLAIPFLSPAATAPIVDAARQGDTVTLRRLIQQRPDVNSAAPDGDTALHWAVYHDDVAMAELLLGAGANVNAGNRYAVKPLSIAATNASARMIE